MQPWAAATARVGLFADKHKHIYFNYCSLVTPTQATLHPGMATPEAKEVLFNL